jgi:hypothetical protein
VAPLAGRVEVPTWTRWRDRRSATASSTVDIEQATAGTPPRSGLGLPIVAALAEASGGALRLFPGYPSGLDAKLSFPAADLNAIPDSGSFDQISDG